jgi:Tfp pilus assembly major pilin PilA
MAGSREITYEIGIDAGDAVGSLRSFSGAVKSAMRDVEGSLDDSATAGDKLSAALDQIAGQTKESFASAAIAAERLGQALQDAGSNLNVADVLPQLNKLGLSFDEITADADKLAVSLKGLDDVKLAGVKDLDETAPGLATNLDEVSKSADSSKSALANMVGNSTQSMGQLLGVTGDLGVGIGQMGEYIADAAFEGEGLASVLGSFVKIAGPMAALAAATALVGEVMSSRGKSSKAEADQVDALTDAYRSGIDPAEAYADSLKKLGEVVVTLNHESAKTSEQGGLVGFLGGLSEKLGPLGGGLQIAADKLGLWGKAVADIAPLLSKAGITVEQWTAAVEGGQQAYGAMATALSKTTLSTKEQQEVLDGLTTSQQSNTEAKANAAQITAVFGDNTDDTTKSVEELQRAEEEAVQATKDHMVAMSQAGDAMHDLSSTFAEIGRRSDALSAVFNLGNAPDEAASKTRDITAAIGDLKDAAKGIKLSDSLDVSNVKADKLLDAFDDLRPQIQAKITEAFAAGGPDAAKATADDYVAQIVASLGGKLSADKVKELLGLTDLDVKIKAALDESTAARVRSELDVLTGLSGETPLTAAIRLALDAGTITPEAAEVLVRAQLGQASVALPTDVTPPTPEQISEAGAFVTATAAQNPASVPTTVDPAGAAKGVEGLKSGIEGGKPAEVPVGADTSGAEKGIEGTKATAKATNPIVFTDADVKSALSAIVALRLYAALLSPQVTLSANVSPAASAIAYIAAQRPQVPVTAYLRDYPSSTDIANHIGVVRVPIDAYLRSTPRITGNLEGG